jgi:hypothetical protein
MSDAIFEPHDQTSRPKFSLVRAKKLVGKRVIIGYSYLKPDGTLDRQEQKHGVVVRASKDGIRVLEHGTAKTIPLPPDLRSWKRARKGTYQLRSTGETVKDPDYLSDWVIGDGHQPSPAGPESHYADSRVFNFYGIGTDLYGRAERRTDGSFIATEWVVFCMLPIYPLASFRIHNRRPSLAFGYGASSKHFALPVALNLRQVVKTYAITYSIILAVALLAGAASQGN